MNKIKSAFEEYLLETFGEDYIWDEFKYNTYLAIFTAGWEEHERSNK